MLKTQIDIAVLITATQDYFYANEEYQKFIKTWVPGWWEGKTAKEREDYTKYTERRDATCNTASMMCKLVNLDYDGIISTVKAANRYERHGGRYDRWSSINLGNIDRDTETKLLRVHTKDSDGWAGFYRSTGRKIKA